VRLSLLNRTAEFVRLVRPSNAVSQMVSLVSELRPDSCVVAEVRASPNHNERKNDMEPDTIVLHYTGTRDVEDKIRQLCTPGSEISAHYVVLQDGYIIQLVPETRRAWHAGVSSWAGDNDLNSRSIGIEIANRGHEHGYPDFPRPPHSTPRTTHQHAKRAASVACARVVQDDCVRLHVVLAFVMIR
jgi:N-acetylmuramoyl-L-alanine amidase